MWERHWHIAPSCCKGGRKEVPGVSKEIVADGREEQKWVKGWSQILWTAPGLVPPASRDSQIKLVPLNNPTWQLLKLLIWWKNEKIQIFKFIPSIRKSSLLLSVPFRRDSRMLKEHFYKGSLAVIVLFCYLMD